MIVTGPARRRQGVVVPIMAIGAAEVPSFEFHVPRNQSFETLKLET
jgi:hypothetical protein